MNRTLGWAVATIGGAFVAATVFVVSAIVLARLFPSAVSQEVDLLVVRTNNPIGVVLGLLAGAHSFRASLRVASRRSLRDQHAASDATGGSQKQAPFDRQCPDAGDEAWPVVQGRLDEVRADLIGLLKRICGMPESACCWLRVWSSDDERAWVEYARDGSDAWLINVSYRQTDAPEVALARSGITLPGWCRISKWRANGVLFKGYIELSGSPPSLEALLDLGNTAVAVFAQAPRESDVCAEVLGR